MLPMKYLSKIGIYEVEFQGAKVKAILVDNEAVLNANIRQFKTFLKKQSCLVVGIDVKVNAATGKVELLILSCVNHCLLIKLPKLISTPSSLKEIFDDKNISFVGDRIHDEVPSLTLQNEKWCFNYLVNGDPVTSISLGGIVEVRDLAAKVLKKPNLCKCGLAELLREVGVTIAVAGTASPSSCPLPSTVSKVQVETAADLTEITCPDWGAVAFSDEEIEYAIHDAYSCYLIGDKLLGFLDATCPKKQIKMIPSKFLSKVGIHEVEIEGVKVKASHVTDNSLVLAQKINQLRASLDKSRPVVGVDVKVTMMDDHEKQHNKTTDLLILFAGNCCLVINLAHLSIFPDCLVSFLANKNTCFVGIGLNDKVGCSYLKSCGINVTNQLSLSNVVEIRDLAARVLKKPNLSKCGLQELDNDVRNTASAAASSDSCPPPDSKTSVLATGTGTPCLNWNAMVFSDEEMKYAIHDAYTCYVIGDKLLGILDAVNL
ncbi:hypothetical protein ACOSP7_008774 [Xanthoceras sorbifolium]